MTYQPTVILLTGGAGFLGRHVEEEIRKRWGASISIIVPKRPGDDLRDRATCERLLQGVDTVIHLAARVGGIGYNQEHPAELFYDNAMMGIQLMDAAYRHGVKKFLIAGTVCAYPKFTPVPFREDDLWNGYPEETNAPYGLAKRMLLVQAQAYRKQYGWNAIYLLPVNLYGPEDEFDPASSHVIPALIRKMVEAREAHEPFVELWGTGKASRDFCFVRDAAEALVLALERYDGADPVNVGNGSEIPIRELAQIIKRLVGYEGEFRWNPEKPDGQPRRSLDVSRAERFFGFRASTPFEEGLRETISWFEQARTQGLI